MVMIGDRLDTDILFGNSSGVDTCLVFTGVTHGQEDAYHKMGTNQMLKPTYFMEMLG